MTAPTFTHAVVRRGAVVRKCLSLKHARAEVLDSADVILPLTIAPTPEGYRPCLPRDAADGVISWSSERGAYEIGEQGVVFTPEFELIPSD